MSTATLESTTSTTTELGITLPVPMAKAIASFGIFTGPKDVAPALQQVKVVFGTDSITVVATDRYVAAKATYAYDGDGTTGTIYLDPAAVKFITGLKIKIGIIAFDLMDGKLKITDFTNTYVGSMFTGKYPEVEPLIDNWQAGSITQATLKIDLLTKLGKVVNPSGDKADVWQFTAGDDSANPNRPVPLMATQGAAKVIIQPNYPSKA
jgi:hypothetical protein